jgi:hypothetical protein
MLSSSEYREKRRQKRQLIEAFLERKLQLYQQLRQARGPSAAGWSAPEAPDRQSPSSPGREAPFGDPASGSVQLEALLREIELLESLREDRLYWQVQLGAVVKTDQVNFLVAVNQSPLRVAGEEYAGVSARSPFLRFAQGLIRGDSFTVANRLYLIREVF